MRVSVIVTVAAVVLGAGVAAQAQDQSAELPVAVEAEPLAAAVDPAAPEVGVLDPAAPGPVSEDEIADQLNKQQQLKQTFTVTRTIDGEVVSTEKRSVVYDRTDPLRPSEAGQSAREVVAAAFDRELLTRPEAFEEARLDFVVADINRDGQMTADEFAALVENWRATAARRADGDGDTARERQYRAFVDDLDPESAKARLELQAREKFAYMVGAAQTLGRDDYIREYLLDFDSMDTDNDSQLTSNELMLFRALNRGEALDLEAAIDVEAATP